MKTIFTDRMTTENNEEMVVFLIGMRINNWWKIHKWLPVAIAMPKMIQELYKDPELGFISEESWLGRTTISVQYWKSFDHLEAYAKNRNAHHLPAWAEFNKKIHNSSDVGIWHETYVIKKGCHESLYHNMPLFGLANMGRHSVVEKRNHSARKRLLRSKNIQ